MEELNASKTTLRAALERVIDRAELPQCARMDGYSILDFEVLNCFRRHWYAPSDVPQACTTAEEVASGLRVPLSDVEASIARLLEGGLLRRCNASVTLIVKRDDHVESLVLGDYHGIRPTALSWAGPVRRR